MHSVLSILLVNISSNKCSDGVFTAFAPPGPWTNPVELVDSIIIFLGD